MSQTPFTGFTLPNSAACKLTRDGHPAPSNIVAYYGIIPTCHISGEYGTFWRPVEIVRSLSRKLSVRNIANCHKTPSITSRHVWHRRQEIDRPIANIVHIAKVTRDFAIRFDAHIGTSALVGDFS